jgi:small subunit ribosomal protein S18
MATSAQNRHEKAYFGYCWEIPGWLTFSLLKIHGLKNPQLFVIVIPKETMSDFQGSFGGGGRRPPNGKRVPRKRSRVKVKIKKKDPLLVDGKRPRPMYVDFKDVEFLTKLVNRHGRIVSRRKSGCTAASQHAVSKAVKRARFMALMPYVGE